MFLTRPLWGVSEMPCRFDDKAGLPLPALFTRSCLFHQEQSTASSGTRATKSLYLLNHTNVFALNQFYGAESSPLPEFATTTKEGIRRQLQFSIDFEL
jgi:hypothetical protein